MRNGFVLRTPGSAGSSTPLPTDDPQSTRAWDVGAVGEERLGQRLNELGTDQLRVLHDRRVPGSRANIDHIAVTPTGVYVIDTKKYRGRPHLKVEGGLQLLTTQGAAGGAAEEVPRRARLPVTAVSSVSAGKVRAVAVAVSVVASYLSSLFAGFVLLGRRWGCTDLNGDVSAVVVLGSRVIGTRVPHGRHREGGLCTPVPVHEASCR